MLKTCLDVDDTVSQVFVAYSGGIDSHVLLHKCATNNQLKNKLTAVYINHGLQAQADQWENHCRQICLNLKVNFLTVKVNAAAKLGESPEEAARNARYSAMKSLLSGNDVLLLAQHAEDQMETVLLQLFRGSGLKGLSGMPESTAFGKGRLLRPLLNTPKVEINTYATTHELCWIEDPTNQQSHYDRNFLRNTVLPLLKERWPALDKTVSRSAKHCADAQVILNDLADDLLKSVITRDNTLDLSRLQNYSLSHQQLIIRQWFQNLNLRMPSQALVLRIIQQVVGAKDDGNPVLTTQNREIRRYRNELYCLASSNLTLAGKRLLDCSLDEHSLRLTNGDVYDIVVSARGIPRRLWQNSNITITFRAGGESICLPGRNRTHRLKNLFQEAGIPPWERPNIPLIYLDGELAAVGEYWIAAAFYCQSQTDCIQIVRRTESEKAMT